jgi:Fructose-2,6-bisphosphatase
VSPRIIHLLRHGPPTRTGLLLGHLDVPALTADCPAILRRVANLDIRQIISSDLSRADAQAERLSEHLDVPHHSDPCWRELNFGAWEGLAPELVDEAALTRFWNDPDTSPPPEGERWSDLLGRVRCGLSRLETDTLVVTHAGTMRAATSLLTGLGHREVWAFDLPYRALLSFRIWPGQPMSGQIIGLDTGYQA